MSGSDAPPLAELLQLFHGVAATECEHRIEHRRHMTGVEEESVAGDPKRISRVIDQMTREEHIGEVGAAHGTARMA